MSADCTNGKSASNALVSRKDFFGTAKHDDLMAALGLSSSESAEFTGRELGVLGTLCVCVPVHSLAVHACSAECVLSAASLHRVMYH